LHLHCQPSVLTPYNIPYGTYYVEMAYKVDMLKSLLRNYNQTIISAVEILG